MSSNEPKFPEVTVQLIGESSNAMSILARTVRALRKAGVPEEARDAYVSEATEGDYDDLLGVTMRWVTVS